MLSVKGYSASTSVHVVDHHPLSPDLPTTWSHHIEETGATTTLLVEGIQEMGIEN